MLGWWDEGWTCDAWFAYMYKSDSCLYECGIESMDLNWCDDCLISMCIVEWKCLMNNVSLLCNVHVSLIECGGECCWWEYIAMYMCLWLIIGGMCCWRVYAMLELRNELVMFELSLCMSEVCVSMINEIELRQWECDMNWGDENVISLCMAKWEWLMKD